MNIGKRLLGLALALIMVFGIAVSPVRAEDNTTISSFYIANQEFVFGKDLTPYEADGTTYQIYDISAKDPEVTVIYSDGSQWTGRWSKIETKFGEAPQYAMPLQDVSGWMPGWRQIPVTLRGCTYHVGVTIVREVISISVAPFSLVEDGDMVQMPTGGPDDPPIDVYNTTGPKAQFTVTFMEAGVETTRTFSFDQMFSMIGAYPVETKPKTDTLDWKAGNTYEWEYSLLGKTCTTQITLVENPIQSIEAIPVEMKTSQSEKMSDGYVPGVGMATYTYYNVSQFAQFNVTYTDGSTAVETYQTLQSKGYNPVITHNQSAANQWQSGNSYTASLTCLGHTAEIPVTIVFDGIVEISVKDPLPLYEEISAYTDYLAKTNPMVTLKWADGTTKTQTLSNIDRILSNATVDLTLETPNESGALAAGQHNVVLTINGVSCTFPIMVLENPIEDITIVPKHDFIQNVHGYKMQTGIDEAGNPIYSFRYAYDTLNYSIEIKLKDGTVEKYGDKYILANKFGVDADACVPSMVGATDLSLGTHTVDVYIMGLCYEQTINIIPTPIKSIVGKYTARITEHASDYYSGWRTEYVNGIPYEWFYYGLNTDNMEFTVTYDDGTTEVLTGNDSILGYKVGSAVTYETHQSPLTPWEVGKNTVDVSILGYEFTMDVEVAKNDVVGISAKATKPLYDGWHEWHGYYDFWYAFPEVTLEFEDGTTKTYSYNELETTYGYSYVKLLNGPDADGPGTKQGTIQFFDLECTFDVVVEENPVESVTAVPQKPLVDGYQGTRVGEDGVDYGYNVADTEPIYTILFKDGTKLVLYGEDQLFERFMTITGVRGDKPNPPFVMGKNTQSLEVLGKTIDFTFEIVPDENPLVKITGEAIAPLYENLNPYSNAQYDYRHLIELTLHYQDGTTVSGTIDELKTPGKLSQIFYDDDQRKGPWGVGKHTISVYHNLFDDAVAEIEIEVVENPYTAVSVQNKDGFTVTLTRKDGSQEILKATQFLNPSRYISNRNLTGLLVTDKGTFSVDFRFPENNYRDPQTISYMEFFGLRSNSLTDCVWLEQQLMTQAEDDIPQIIMNYSSSDLKDLVASDGDALNGTVSRVWLAISDVSNSLSEEDAQLLKQKMDEELKGYETGIIMDMTVYKSYEENQNTVSKVANTKPMTITMAVPQELLDSGINPSDFKIARIHNGEVEVLDAVYNKEDQTVTFVTDRFSTYSLTYSTAAEHTMTKVEAKAPTCTEDGNVEYYNCSVCKKNFADAKGEKELTTVVEAAKGHKLTKVEAKAATCTAAGTIEHYSCDSCKKLFADAEAKTETTAEKVAVAAKGHTEVAVAGKAATCTETGLTEGKKCAVCGTVTVEQKTIDALGHKLTKVEAKAATYTEDGNIEHYACACGKLFADAESKKEITDVVIPQLIKVEEEKAEVSKDAVDNALADAKEKAEETGKPVEVIIEVPKAPVVEKPEEKPQEVIKVELPVEALENVAKEEATLTVVLPSVTVTVDTDALKSITEQAAGNTVTLVVEQIEEETLTKEQQEVVKKYDVAVTIKAEFICQETNEKIWTEDNNAEKESGSVTVKMPFTPAEGTEGADYTVLFIDDDGTVKEIETAFEDGHLVFALEHFSEYVVVNTKTVSETPDTGDNAILAPFAMLLSLSFAGVAVLVSGKKKLL